MTRTMYDATSANEANVDYATAQMAAVYTTGSPDVEYSAAQIADLAAQGLVIVTIDQGFTGSPDPDAVVRDVERGAWTAQSAVDRSNWTAKRPTVYAARNDMLTVIADGWTKDIWLAWPSASPPTREFVLSWYPELAKANLVAVQWQFDIDGTHDASVVYDNTWPNAAPPVPTFTEKIVQQLPTLKSGNTGEAVRTLQGCCYARHQGIAIDGIFGQKTDAAVRTIQAQHHLVVDGIVGPKTWPVMMGVA